MNRKKKLILNSGSGFLRQIIAMICGFILPRYMLLYFGSSLNGLTSSITNFLGFISFLELGIGPVIQANLYAPLAKNDDEQISRIVISSERFFRKISYIFLVYIAVLMIVFPKFINKSYGMWFTASLILIISISTFAQYFFGMTYQLLLNADQKAYIQNLLQIITIVLNTVLCIVLIKLGAKIHMVKLVASAVFVLRPFLQMVYVKKHYKINKKLILNGEPIKQKWNGFAQHLAAVVCSNTDITILTIFSSLANVSIYSVYYNVTNGVTSMVMTAATGLESYFGNMIANNEKDTLKKSFQTIEWIVHTIVIFIFTIAAITIVPFVSVYTRGIRDANYITPMFALILVLAYAVQCLRIPYFRIIKAAGHFKETQNGAFISMIINIVISIVLVFKFGLPGIAMGTLIAMLYHTAYFAWYLRSNIINRPLFLFVKYLITDTIIFTLSYFLTKQIVYLTTDYLSWLILAIKTALICLSVVIVVNLFFYFSFIKNIFNKIRIKSNIENV